MSPRARYALALAWGAAEASLFFVIPDVIVGWIALRRGWRAGVLAALAAAVGAILGGLALYAWSAQAPDAALRAVAAVPAVPPAMIDKARVDIAADGWFRAALAGPATSTPYKVYAVLAPAAGVGAGTVAALTAPVRLPRFLFAAIGFALLGAVVRQRVPARLLAAAYLAGWSCFYLWFWVFRRF